jgi:RNA polymerase sigma-70 factor (ECF subfamily)
MERIQKEFLAAYDAHAEAIYRHIFFRVYSKARAEELAQETFMKTWDYIKDGKQVENLRAFLYRVATNLVIDDVRKKKENSLDAMMEESDAWEPSADGRDEAERRVELRRVLETMERLDDDAREILTMRYVDDLDPKDIGETLGITANNASVRLNRAMKLLQEKFHND